MSVKTLILKIPSPKNPHSTPHTTCMHVPHTHREGRRNETMELAVCSSTFICLLSYFLLSLRHSKEEEVTMSKIYSKPSSEHNIFR